MAMRLRYSAARSPAFSLCLSAAALCVVPCAASARARVAACFLPGSHRRARPARFYAPAYGVFIDGQVHFPARLEEKRRTGAQKKWRYPQVPRE